MRVSRVVPKPVGAPCSAKSTHRPSNAEAHFVVSGRVQVLLRFEGTGDLITEVLTEHEPVVGWSVFRPPYRYTASIRCETDTTAVTVPRSAFEELFADEPTLEATVLSSMAWAPPRTPCTCSCRGASG